MSERVLWWTAAAHAASAIFLSVLLAFPAHPVLGAHPALKPWKFAVSITIFLATLALLVPRLGCDPGLRRALAVGLAGSMALEMVPIAIQAARGRTSHFNTATPVDAALWHLMMVGAVVATACMVVLAVVASARPLVEADGSALDLPTTFAWRAGLWLLPVGAFIGFAMGGRLAHSIGGSDGGPGLPLLGWSTRYGDLRVAHFFALHALQLLPALAWTLRAIGTSERLRWTILLLALAVSTSLIAVALERAHRGAPLVTFVRPTAITRRSPSAGERPP